MIGDHERFVAGVVFLVLVLAAAAPGQAQSDFEPLFDRFNFKIAGSWMMMTTEIRLDSEIIGEGTTLSFEDDLNLGKNKTVPTVAFEWQIARKHKLGVRWQDIGRDSSAHALTEIQWGDEIIPVDADITLGFDITQTFVDYAYYPWVKENWAAGFGLGLRVMGFSATLAWREGNLDVEDSSEVKALGPLPYLYFEYRRLFSDHWRFITGLGWLHVEIGDIKGGQWIGRTSIEYLLGKNWAFGGALNLAKVNVDWRGLENTEGQDLYTGAVDLAVHDLSVFGRVRF